MMIAVSRQNGLSSIALTAVTIGSLFFQRRRIGRMSRVVLRKLQVGHGRKVPGGKRVIESGQIVVVVGARSVRCRCRCRSRQSESAGNVMGIRLWTGNS